MNKHQAFLDGMLAQRNKRIAEERPYYHGALRPWFDQGAAYERKGEMPDRRYAYALAYCAEHDR